jgi:hypothetical protein
MNAFTSLLVAAFLAADPSAPTATVDGQASYGLQAKDAADARAQQIAREIAQVEKSLKAKDGAGKLEKRKLADRIKSLKAELKELKAGKLVVPSLQSPHRKGQIGKPDSPGADVLQIIGPEEMLAQIVVIGPDRAVDGNIIRGQTYRTTMLIRGMPTSLATDGARIALPELMEITGNYTYETTSGASRTVWVFEPFKLAASEDKGSK